MDKPSFLTTKQVAELIQGENKINIIDRFENQLEELYCVKNPGDKKEKKGFLKFRKDYLKGKNSIEKGNWVYLPWLCKVFHILPEEEFFEVRTARNKPLISQKDQEDFYNKSVGIVGLSVGNSVALAIAYSGGCKHIKLADPDSFELSNLNRVRVGIGSLGENKAYVCAKQIYEINPYANIEIYSDGVNHSNLRKFLLDPKIDFLIDEADDITLKFYLRLACRAEKIPLLMATDNGFNIDLDVLRFDKTSSAGNMKKAPIVTLDDVIMGLKHSEPLRLTEVEEINLINELIGINNVSYEMQKASILKIKRKIAGWPQLAIAAFAGGSILAFALSRISAEKSFKSNKSTINMKDLFIPGNSSKRNVLKEKAHLIKFKEFMKNHS